MMAMSSTWWFDELPESMTEAEYRDLPAGERIVSNLCRFEGSAVHMPVSP